MEHKGTLRKADWSNQGIVETCMYGLLAKDYFKGRTCGHMVGDL